MRQLCVGLIYVSVGLAFLPTEARCQADSAIDDIWHQWARRQARLTSLQLTWSEKHFMTQGSQIGKDLRGKDDQGFPFPKKDTLVKRKVSLVFGRNRWRLETKGSVWWSMTEALLDVHQIDIFDGDKYVSYFGLSLQDDDAHKVGFLYAKGPNRRPRNATKDPRIWAPYNLFRPFHTVIGNITKSKWKLSRTTATVANRNCVVIERIRKPNSQVFERAFLDPNRGYVILRKTLGIGEHVLVKIDIEHVSDSRVGWVPSRWNVIINRPEAPDKLSSTYEAKVTSCKVNEPVTDSWFEFEFPPGTEVIDKLGDEDVSYIVKPSSKKRIITDVERMRGARYKEFMRTESGEAGKVATDRLPVWFWIINAVIAIVIALSAWWFIRRRSA